MKKKQYFEIVGGNKLFGEIKNQTSKNATLPILTASILCDGEVQINNYPKITDVFNMIDMLRALNVKVDVGDDKLIINAEKSKYFKMDDKLSKTMRSSLFLLGPALIKYKTAFLSMPGGCNIGKRPIDIHLKALKKFGVKVINLKNMLFFDANKVHSSRVKLKIPSVGATENIVQFASLLKGKTTIINPAKEPEVVDLCNFLNGCGAKIIGAGTDKITIYGVDKLYNSQYTPCPDRIVAGTIMCCVAACGGIVKIKNCKPQENLKLIEILRSIGCNISTKNDIITIESSGNLNNNFNISTGFYPDFATDLQSVLLPVGLNCNSVSTIEETVFENRFLIVEELKKMGADIEVINNRVAKIHKSHNLKGAKLIAKDLRGGAALVIAGLMAKGKSKIGNIEFIDRGYENLEIMLSSLGAEIKRK